MYQAGANKIAETVNKDAEPGQELSVSKAKQFITKYFSEAQGLKKFIDKANGDIMIDGYIYSFFGRKRRLPESKSKNRGAAQHAIRSGVNFLVQSVASDVNILALVDLFKWIDEMGYEKDIIPFTVVHDSIVSEVREDLIPLYSEMLKKFIQTDRGISIPNCPIGVDIEVGDSWGELTSLSDYLSSLREAA